LALAALALIVAGCGSSGGSGSSSGESTSAGGEDSSSLTKADLIKQGDAICKQGNEDVEGEANEFAKENGIDVNKPSTSDQEEVVSQVIGPAIMRQAEKIGELGAPSGEEEEVEAIVAAVEAGVPNYIDKQLSSAWGAGERLYRGGPWQPGTPSQGYQLPFTPAELFRTALAAINAELKANTPLANKTAFAKMGADAQDAYLRELEAGGKDLGGVPSNVFFSALWESTVEGFFSDPVYGGNRDMAAWRMIGFPGAYASYYDLVDQHGVKVDRAPTSLSEDVHGQVHVHPAIPARLP